MREILFRGQRAEDGEWVEGGVAPLMDDNSYVVNKKTSFFIQVIPETVGQYTGLTDKNDKKIFEGDLCHLVYPKAYQVRLKRSGNYDYSPTLVYKVEYRMNRFELSSVKGNCYEDYIYLNDDRIMVIGKAYDNPKLLEEII